MPIDPVRLTRALVDQPSVTGEELAVAALVERELQALCLAPRRDEAAPQRANVFAAASERPRVIFCSHLDTVPPFIPSSEDVDFIYGRGACDAKGMIAAMITAGERLLGEGIRDLGFLFVVGEETDSIGAKTANEALAGIGSEYVILGEPTESHFVRASKGACTATVCFDGIAAHSAYPERGDSAIRKLIAAITAIEAADWGSDENLGRTTVNIGVIRGGDKPNIVPAWAEAEMIFRTVQPWNEVRQRLEEIVARFDGRLVRAIGNDPTFMMVPDGRESVVVAFNTDAPHLKSLGKPILFGPGSILDAHTAGEKIAKRDLLDAVDTYCSLARELLS
jgi:acetylornithine deacetylase